MSLWKLALLIALFNLMTFGNGPGHDPAASDSPGGGSSIA